MVRKWHVKAETASTLIMWFGGLIAILIAVLWFTRHMYPYHEELDRINNDLKALQHEFNQGCNSLYYESRYNPFTEQGFFSINNTEICINGTTLHVCKPLICPTNHTTSYNLESLSFIHLVKNETFNTFPS